ncbi:surfactant protein C-like [Branchiostoma lanceolatum]|uniref:surfactant protein C-like n=1 Tax=Branchiostoma lanceolatum TaxID=7740 RepID=UPI00345376C6
MTSSVEKKDLPHTDLSTMASSDEKKDLPPPSYTERPPGGVFPEEIAKIKQETRAGDKLRRKKIVIGVVCAVLGVLLVVGLVKLGVHLSKDPIVKRNLKFRDGNKLFWETVETDEDEGTDTFYTESDNGAAAVMYDHNKDLKAYKFTGRDICYIVPEDEGEDEKAKEAARELGNKEEESTQASKNGGRRKMSLDESRTDAPELSEAMGLFCGDLEPRWATIELPDDDDATGGIVLIAPDPDSSGGASAETRSRVRRGWLWGRRRTNRRWHVSPTWNPWGFRVTWYF